MTKTEKQQAAIEDLRLVCPKVIIEAWYDATGGIGTGRWKIRGWKLGNKEEPVIVIVAEFFVQARHLFRLAYERADAGGLL